MQGKVVRVVQHVTLLCHIASVDVTNPCEVLDYAACVAVIRYFAIFR
jgi:hypothetical protein